MIKIGCCTYSYRDYIKAGLLTVEGFIEESYRNRLDGVELTGYYFSSTDKHYLHRLRRLCLERGLSISMVSCGAHLWSPQMDMDKTVKEIKKWIDIAFELGAPCLRVFGGRWPPPEDLAERWKEKEEAKKVAVEVGKICADYGSENGVVIALENHGGITDTADDVLSIVKGVNSRWFRLNLDTGNYRRNTYTDIRKSMPYAVHVHAKVSVRKGKIREKLDYRKIKEIFEEAGYNGWISIEYEEEEDPMRGVPKFLSYLIEIFT